ncbi:MAG: putative O-glycosylation ligase, exosortase A system-associated [Gammaproteobacteria bacterium]|nr:putative O-glycosylation ligase, exosortase A system-associated [Gammaproteobacteria bacterium]
MRDLIVAALILGSLPVILIRPFFGLLVWCWISYMLPHKLGYGFAVNKPWAMIVGSTFLVSFLFSKESKRLPVQPVTVGLLIFILWMVVCHFVHPNTPDAWAQFDKVMKIQLITLVIMMLVNTRERLTWMLWVVVGSIGFYGVKGGIFTIVGGGQNLVWGPPTGFYEGNNELALTLLMTIPLMRFLQLQLKQAWQRHAMSFAMLMSAAAVFGSFSRGALLAAAAMGVFLWLKSRKKLALGIVIACVGIVGVALMPQKWHDRMATIGDNPEETDASARGRINAWWLAYFVASKEPFGGGFDTFTQENFYKYDTGDRSRFDPAVFFDVHSIYFQMLGEHGFIGLGLFLMVAWLAWRACAEAMRLGRRREELRWVGDLGGMLQVSFIAYAVGGLFLGMGYFDLYYHLIATVVAMGVIVKTELAKAPGASLPWEKKPGVLDEPAKPRFAPMPGFTPGRRG